LSFVVYIVATVQWCNQDFFQDQDQDLNFTTKTKTLKFFQDQDQDQDFASQDQGPFCDVY